MIHYWRRDLKRIVQKMGRGGELLDSNWAREKTSPVYHYYAVKGERNT